MVDDGSTDRTGEILAALARQSPRLRVIAGSDPPGGWLGKPHALSLASRAASGELLLFVDADVRYDPRALSEAVDLMEAENADLLALLPWIEARGFWENVLMPYLAVSLFFGPAFLANRDRPRWFARLGPRETGTASTGKTAPAACQDQWRNRATADAAGGLPGCA